MRGVGVLLLVVGVPTMLLGVLWVVDGVNFMGNPANEHLAGFTLSLGVFLGGLGGVSIAAAVGLLRRRSWGSWLAVAMALTWAVIIIIASLLVALSGQRF